VSDHLFLNILYNFGEASIYTHVVDIDCS